jgi:predicted glutamine amidotransferase
MEIIMMLLICLGPLIMILNKIFKIPYDRNCLGCGMVGYCGDKEADPGLLKLALMYNQERGEDSTGMVINNNIVKETEKVMKFLTKNNIVTSSNHKNFTFIAHARKSSSGGKVKELAHPFGIYKNGLEKDCYDLVLAMNGTLTNTDLLSKEFDVEHKSHMNSDTQTLAKIMTKLGEKEYNKALESYDGTATLLFFSPKYPNTLMVYKDPERPLFYWQKSKTEMYISSMDEPLWAMGATIEDVNSFEDNKLYRINKGKITKIVDIERKPIKSKIIVYGRGYSSNVMRYGDNFNYSHMGGGCAAAFRKNSINNNSSNGVIDMFKSIISDTNKSGKHIYCQVDRYFRNGHPVMDEMYLDSEGKIRISEKDEGNFKKYYFIAGFLIKDEDAYKEIIEKTKDTTGKFSLPKFKDIKLSELCKYFSHPCMTICDNKQIFLLNGSWSEKVTDPEDKFIYSVPFTDFKYTLKYTGKVIQTSGINVKVCEVVDVSKNIILSDNTESSVDTFVMKNLPSTIQNVILNNPTDSAGEIYTKIRTNYLKDNNTDAVRRFYYKKLFCVMKDLSIVSIEDHDRVFKLGEACSFNVESGDFGGEIEFILRCYRNHMQKKVELESTFSQLGGNENINDEVVAKPEYLDQTVINSLVNSNPFYKDEKFKQSFYDLEYSDLGDYSKDWISDYHKNSVEFRQFCEAILLCLNVIGRISVKEFTSMIAMSDKDLSEATEKAYVNYRSIIIEEPVYEVFTEKEYEEEQINAYKDFLNGLTLCIKGITDIPENLRSPLVKRFLNYYVGTNANQIVDIKTKQDD